MASLRAGHNLARRLTSKSIASRIPVVNVAACRRSPVQRHIHTAQPSRTTQTQLPGKENSRTIEQLKPSHPARIKQTQFPLNEIPERQSRQPSDATGGPVRQDKFSQFDLTGKVFVVTGGARGLGLTMAEGLVEAGGKVHCLDIRPEPSEDFYEAQKRVATGQEGSLQYHQVNVSNAEALETLVDQIAGKKQRLDGLIAAAGIQQVTSALDFKPDDIRKMLDVNYIGVFLAARACARQMLKYKIQGSMCLIASMSGTIANKGFIAPVYNSSKAAVIQLARNLAMEWGRMQEDGSGGIRVNTLSPGHILTPMVKENFKRGEADRKAWEENSMLGRISEPEEYKGAGVFLLSKASSYMTGQNLIIDGGCTAW